MTPLVFISYSHDSEAHRAWTLKFAADLRAYGIDAILDQWDLKLGQDLARFMESGITKSNRVLLICTDNYVSKANSGMGGVGYERLIVNAEVASSIDTMKFIPCIRGSTNPKIPTFLGARAYVDFSEDKDYQARLEQLARELLGTPANAKPPLGQHKSGALDGLVLGSGPFTQVKSTTAPSVFFEKDEPLTIIERYGRAGTKPVMPDGPKFYLRLIPTYASEPLSSAKAYEIVRGHRGLAQ